MQEHIKQIEQQGYCVLPQVLNSEQVGRALELVQDSYEKSVDTLTDLIPFLNRNQPIVYNLQNKDYYFLELLFSAEQGMKLLRHFLNDPWYKPIPPDKPNFIMRSFLARSSNEKLPMHIDSFVPYGGPYAFIMQCGFALEDQTIENGCTMVVPGSHLTGSYATQEALKDAVPLESRAGDMVLWDSRIWHGTQANTSGGTRWALIATFSRWWLKQAFNIPENLPQEIYDRLTDEQRAVLGYCSLPYDDETVGIDMKRGYDLLPQRVEHCRRGATPQTQVG